MKLKEFAEKYGEYEIEENKLEELKGALKEPSKAWKPEQGGEYYFLDSSCGILRSYWNDYSIDQKHLSLGNCYKTREAAEKAIRKLKITQELKELAKGYEFTPDKDNWHLCTAVLSDGTYFIDHCKWSRTKCSEIYFDTFEDLDNAINVLGEERILKDYFGIETEEE